MSLVLDGSATLCWCLEDEASDSVDEVFELVANAGAIVPALWRYEVANGLQMAVRRGRISVDFRDSSLADLMALEVQVDPEGDAVLWTTVVEIAHRHGLTVYDASYLELAQRRRIPLATLDGALARAAEAESVPVIGA